MKFLCALLTSLFLLFAQPANALDISKTELKNLVVLHEGRLKPMQSFAHNIHWLITGRKHPKDISDTQWLANIIFDPLTAIHRPDFTIRNPELQDLLKLEERKSALYSYAEVSSGMAAHTKMLTALLTVENPTKIQDELLKLQYNIIQYTQLMRSLSLIMPVTISWPGADYNTYYDLARFEGDAQKQLDAIIKKKGDDLDRYNDKELAIVNFTFEMSLMRDLAESNELLRIIPIQWDKGNYLSPWAIMQSGKSDPSASSMMKELQAMVMAWQNDNDDDFARHVMNFKQLANDQQLAPASFVWEELYNHINPFNTVFWIYILVVMGCVASYFVRFKPLIPALTALLSIGCAVHVAGIILRIIILDRPPVATLYETVLFVSATISISTIFIAKGKLSLLGTGAATSAGLLVLAPFLIQNGDTMPVLVAVLNNNFWLATHVIIITAGYGFSILCAIIAHIWLILTAFKKRPPITLAHKLALWALLFTTIGTILGGIWADQSWGRFWGWDPKENGALLIVLWILWALHGKRSGDLKAVYYIAALAALNIIVALAWFGVNLLNVGLHSYGFTEGVFASLIIFCLTELLIIASLIFAANKSSRIKQNEN
jgi:ABC-type transport system involved in cytochrome c biogenesis permease subunit